MHETMSWKTGKGSDRKSVKPNVACFDQSGVCRVLSWPGEQMVHAHTNHNINTSPFRSWNCQVWKQQQQRIMVIFSHRKPCVICTTSFRIAQLHERGFTAFQTTFSSVRIPKFTYLIPLSPTPWNTILENVPWYFLEFSLKFPGIFRQGGGREGVFSRAVAVYASWVSATRPGVRRLRDYHRFLGRPPAAEK